MLFIVPDGDPTEENNTGANPPAGETPAGGSSDESSEGGDGSNSGASEAEAKFKVELDLDDAPFLEEETVEEPKPEAPPPAEEKEVIEEEKKESFIKRLLKNKKKLIIIGGGALLLIITLVVVLFLFMGGDDAAPEKVEQPAEEVSKEEVDSEEGQGEEEKEVAPIIFKVVNGTGDDNPTILPYQFLINWDPFLVPLKGSEGEIRLLQCKVAIPVNDEALHAEIEKKKSALRDAVFYYLSHRPFGLLDTPEAQAAFKRDIISVINERVLSAKIQDILIEDYLVQGP